MAMPKKGKKIPKISVNRAWCKACGICIAFCPKKVLDPDDEHRPLPARPEDCSACRLCEFMCPDFAIEVDGGDGE